LSLRAGYVAASALIAGVILASYVLFAVGAGGRSHSYSARERAELLTDIILNSFLSQSHSGGKADVERFMSYLSDSRAGGVKNIRLLSPGGADMPYTMVMLKRDSSAPITKLSKEGRQVVEVTRAIVNQDSCRECHTLEGDVLAFLSVEVEADGSGFRASDLKGRLVRKALVLGMVMLGLLVLAAVFFKEKRPPVEGPAPGWHEEPGSNVGRGGFGALFMYLNTNGKTPDATSIQSMEKVEKMATIGELSSAIAHEIKNPLAGISGAVQVLSEGFPADDPRREVVDEVLAVIQRLDKTVRNLLSFARPPEPSLIRAPVTDIIELTATLIAGQAKKQFVDVNIVPADRLAVILADPDLMQQVLLNIMMNALHVMPEGGTITVATRILAGKGVVEVDISDTGGGIAEKDMAYIFEPFFTTRSSGTGLGLAICKSIVERHGGTVGVRTAQGGGSMFTIRLPLKENPDD